MANRVDAELIGRLRATPGLEVRPNEPLARFTTFRIGGPAELLVEARSERALLRLVAAVDAAGVSREVLGLGSNLLVPDDGLSGVIIRLTGGFRRLRIDGMEVEAGAAVALAQLARRTAQAGLAGMEALSGFPSTVGGAVIMNAGCYGTEIKDLLRWATVVERGGRRRRLAVEELRASYRRTALQGSGAIVSRARFALSAGDTAASMARIEELNRKRWQSLPGGRHAGSVFRNPEGDYAGRLIELCGLKGCSSGGARISRRHGNVIVNEGKARAADVLALMLSARRAVSRKFAVELEPELVLTGSLADSWRRAVSG